jgi:hypothetical protein
LPLSSPQEQDDTDDFIGYLHYLAEKAKEECIVDQLPVMPEGMDDEEATRFTLKAHKSIHRHYMRHLGIPRWPCLMGLSKEEALRGCHGGLMRSAPRAARSPWEQWHE